jgi:hypothetical protein
MLSFWKNFYLVGLEILTTVVMKSSILWDIMPCSPLKVTSTFMVKELSQATNQYEAHSKQSNIS